MAIKLVLDGEMMEVKSKVDRVGVLIWRSFRRQCKLKRRCQMRTKRLQGMLEMVFVIMLATIYLCCWGNSGH